MGQKANPIGLRINIIREPDSICFARGRSLAKVINADRIARVLLKDSLAQAGIAKIRIERPAKNARVTIEAARPGIVIGKKGQDIEKLREILTAEMGVPVFIRIEEVKKPELNAFLVAQNIAQQLERRVMFRRAMKRSMVGAMRLGAKGIKIAVAGRLGGAEIARTEKCREGRVPLHTFRADIDYGLAEAKTTYGIIGVKVWIFKGEILDRKKKITKSVEENLGT